MKKQIIGTVENLSRLPPGTVYYGNSEYAVTAEEAEMPVVKVKKYEADIAADGTRIEKFRDKNWKKAIKPPKPVKTKVAK